MQQDQVQHGGRSMGSSRRGVNQETPRQDGIECLPVPPLQGLAHNVPDSPMGETDALRDDALKEGSNV